MRGRGKQNSPGFPSSLALTWDPLSLLKNAQPHPPIATYLNNSITPYPRIKMLYSWAKRLLGPLMLQISELEIVSLNPILRGFCGLTDLSLLRWRDSHPRYTSCFKSVVGCGFPRISSLTPSIPTELLHGGPKFGPDLSLSSEGKIWGLGLRKSQQDLKTTSSPRTKSDQATGVLWALSGKESCPAWR